MKMKTIKPQKTSAQRKCTQVQLPEVNGSSGEDSRKLTKSAESSESQLRETL